ncbi:hypothetical protein F7725_017922 [Dissostichus mawsoni]|uniref:BRO1 domain-containing protein n=1 Tax=Dissostichus mawsoni TaxID=36200 RepID=A0A7J5XQ13_DISMA|nr:hypothetical protein F7725_017922 [Dissostichus mawsoni]
MEAVPRMPMIWLDLKEAGDFQFSPSVRQSAVNVTRDFEGCSTLRKYFGQLHYLQSRVPMGTGQEAAVPISWTEIFSGKTVTHDDISYEQACILYNLDHFSHNFSVDMSHQILNLNINLMLGQAQECLLEKSMLDNRKSFLVARISAQVVDYYKEACRALENSETASMLGKIQKDWKKLVQMKIYYFASIAHLHMGKQAEEQQKYGESGWYLQSSIDKLSEAIKLAKVGQPDSVQDALRFTMDVIGGKCPLVKALPVNPTDPSVTGPDLFAKLVPMAAHEASSLYSEEKAKLLRDVMIKIDSKNETLEQFMDSLGLEPESVDNLDMYSHIPPVLMEKCAALSVRPDTVKSLIQSMQGLSGVFTDVESSLKEIRDVLEEDKAGQRAFRRPGAPLQASCTPGAGPGSGGHPQGPGEIHGGSREGQLHQHGAPQSHEPAHQQPAPAGGAPGEPEGALPRPQLSEEEVAGLQCMKRILGKVHEMREQRGSLEKQLRDLIQQDDITSTLVTTERADMRRTFEDQLKKYEQVKVYLDQNLAAQENILKALTEANVQYASVRKGLSQTEQQWNGTVQGLVGSYEAYEDLMKKSQEGKEFYEDLEDKASPAKPSLQARSSDGDSACSSLDDPELAQLSAAILALGGDLPEELRSLPPDITSLPPGHEHYHPPELTWVQAPSPGLGRASPLTCPPLSAGPDSTLPCYRPPHPHAPQPGLVAPAPVRPSTTTVDSIQAPIPSYAHTPHHPGHPAASTGYAVPPQMGGYPQFMARPGMPIHGPPNPNPNIPTPNIPNIPTPNNPNNNPSRSSRTLRPWVSRCLRGTSPGRDLFLDPTLICRLSRGTSMDTCPPSLGFLTLPAGVSRSAAATSAKWLPAPASDTPGLPAPPRLPPPAAPSHDAKAPQTVPPHIPPTSQPTPPTSQPYMPHPHQHQQMPPGLPHPHMMPQQQQIPPHPQMHIPGPRVPPTSQQMPPTSLPALHAPR